MKPLSIDELRDVVQGQGRLVPYGGSTKTGLNRLSDGTTIIDMTGLAGIVDYEPSEYTFTALAGTRLKQVEKVLAENGQYLPFDPVMIDQGATLGGAVASGLSGAGRYRYGGVRDFILGVKFMNGAGELIQGGGKVVKNAAGFDLPKLMVGSLGQYGVLVELSFKVFPKPTAFTTLRRDYPVLQESLSALYRLTSAPMDVFALDIMSDKSGATLLVRLCGEENLFPARVERLRKMIDGGEVIAGGEEAAIWHSAREFKWLPDRNSLAKVPITPKLIPDFDRLLENHSGVRRYSAGANVAWISWQEEIDGLSRLLTDHDLSGLLVIGEADKPIIGKRVGAAFATRVKKALDPTGKWVEV